jgi:outer membrane protein insertion porin family
MPVSRSYSLRFTLLACLLLTAVGGIATAAPIIRDIRIQGLESVSQDDILAILQSRVGEPLDQEKLQADQRAIINYGTFSPDVRVFAEDLPQGRGVNLIFTVKENPVVSRIDIYGNVAEPADRLESLVEQRVGERLGNRAAQQAEEAIADYYRRQGHSGVQVHARRAALPDGTVALSIEIDEGQVLKIGEVSIEGNEAFSSRRLKFKMTTRSSGLFGTNHFSEDSFEQDLMNLQSFYFDHGYLDAVVERGRFTSDAATQTINPAVVIHEGPRYRFGEFRARGNTLFSDLEVLAPFDDLRGEWFSAEKLRGRLQRVRDMCGDEGHINAVAEPRLNPDPQTQLVNVTVDIQEGPRVTVGSIYLERSMVAPELEPPVSSFISRVAERISPPVREDTIRRVITLKEGDVYRHYQEVRSLERLRRLGIFTASDGVKAVDITRRPTADPTVEDAVISVNQQSTGFLTVGAGLGDEAGVFGFVRITESNLFGEADAIRASVLLGTRALNFDVTYFDRFIRDTDLSLRLSAYRSDLSRREYDETRTGVAGEIGQPLTDYVQLFYGLRSEYVSFHLDNDASDKTRRSMDSYWLTLAQLRISEDRRDDVEWPTRGWLRGVGLEAGWADDWLVKIFGEAQYYRRLYREVIFAWNLQAGVIPRSVDDVAFGERFFLGGSEDLRGFRFRGAGPVDSDNHNLFTGGSTKLLSQFEIRYPIYHQLRGVVFFDTGSLGEDPFVLEALRASAGVGLRLAIPGIGHLALDIAQAVASQSHDDHQTLHFTFRTDF